MAQEKNYKVSQSEIDSIKETLTGYTKADFEYIFESVILPLYTFQTTTPLQKPNWKIVNRETNLEYVANDDFDKKFGFILKCGLDTDYDYYKTKEYYLRRSEIS